MNELDHTIKQRDAERAWNALEPITFDQMMAVVNEWLLVVDPGVIKLLHAVIFSNRMAGDPVWLFLIAQSSGGKTELMNGFLKVPTTYSLSQLTPNTFLSGYKSKEKTPSLLHQLDEQGKNTLLFKDFTSLLDGNRDELKELMGQFRELYDGYMVKRLGTGDELTWEGKMGFVAGCTPIIEQRLSVIGAMGERFLSYRMKQPRRAELRAKMKSNIGKDGKMRDAIQDAFAAYQKGLEIPATVPILDEATEKTIEAITDFIAITRAVVIRGTDNKKEIEYLVEPEQAGRVYKQFYTLACILTYMNGGVLTEEDVETLRTIARSSVHSVRYNIIRCLLSYTTQVKTSTLSIELGYPTSTMRRYLEDLAAISMDEGHMRILRRTHQGKGKADLWELTTEMKDILTSMGEKVEATKADKDFEVDEEDLPVGAIQAQVGPTQEELTEYQQTGGQGQLM